LLSFSTSALGQSGASAVQSYFTGKQVILKIDMLGSQKGVDLRFNKPTPMDWKEYGSRIKQFGVAIHQGDLARVTSVVVKNDMIEFQLDAGGFGTFGDDTNTTVTAKPIDKSDYEKSLEKEIADTEIRTRSSNFSVSSIASARVENARTPSINSRRSTPAR
jgi:hypothetical protein